MKVDNLIDSHERQVLSARRENIKTLRSIRGYLGLLKQGRQ